MSKSKKSDKCPACAIEQRFGILLEYDHYRIDNFTETITRLCGECKEKFRVSDLATLIAELQDNHIFNQSRKIIGCMRLCTKQAAKEGASRVQSSKSNVRANTVLSVRLI